MDYVSHWMHTTFRYDVLRTALHLIWDRGEAKIEYGVSCFLVRLADLAKGTDLDK